MPPKSRIPRPVSLDELRSDLVVFANHVRGLEELHSDLVAFANHVCEFANHVRIRLDQLNAPPPAPGDSSGHGASGSDVGSDAAPPGVGSVAAPSGCTGNQGERRSAPYGPATRWRPPRPAIPKPPTDLLSLFMPPPHIELINKAMEDFQARPEDDSRTSISEAP